LLHEVQLFEHKDKHRKDGYLIVVSGEKMNNKENRFFSLVTRFDSIGVFGRDGGVGLSDDLADLIRS
jgi:hypothetical protein